MPRRLLIIIFAVFFTVAAILPAVGNEPAPALQIVENDWPPYYFKDKSAGLPGFARQILETCLSELGYRTTFAFYPVKRMYHYLEKGEIDIAVFSYRKSRESFVWFSREPIFCSGYRPVVRAKSGIQIRRLSDFDPLRIGHLAGLRYSKPFLAYIENRRDEGRLIISTRGDSCLRMLTSGIIDVFVDTEATTRWRAKQMGVTGQIRILPFDIRTRDYFVTLSKQSPRIEKKQAFLKKLDQRISAMKKDGRYAKIASRYGL